MFPHQFTPDNQHLKYINPYLIMFGSAESLKPSNNPQCKQQMLDWIKARWTESVYSSLMQLHPFLFCRRGQIHPFFWHATLASLHNDEPALLLSPRIITCDRRTDAQGFFASLLWDFLFFFFLTVSARICFWLLLPHAFIGLIHCEPFRRL